MARVALSRAPRACQRIVKCVGPALVTSRCVRCYWNTTFLQAVRLGLLRSVGSALGMVLPRRHNLRVLVERRPLASARPSGFWP